jgi:alkylhydroperoxidase family enzyme
MNASGAMQNGASAEKVEALMGNYRKSGLFSARERLALELAERMTYTNKRVTDEFFRRLQKKFKDEELVELAAVIALENFRSKFNSVFGIESQGFCQLPVVKAAASAAGRRFVGKRSKSGKPGRSNGC